MIWHAREDMDSPYLKRIAVMITFRLNFLSFSFPFFDCIDIIPTFEQLKEPQVDSDAAKFCL